MKNIVICSDGTWQSPESDSATHVLRLARSIAPETPTGHKQVVFYDWGVGSEGDRLSGGITGVWMADEAALHGLALEPYLLRRFNPDYAGRMHNEYKGFYRAMGRKHVRTVEPLLHASVKQRWEDETVKYKSPGLAGLVKRVGWEGVTLVERGLRE